MSEDEQKESDGGSKITGKRKATPADKERKLMKKKKRKEEKLKMKEESQENEKNARKNALDYLRQWKRDRSSWSFKKKRQIWLVKHMYDDQLLSDTLFKTLLKYLENIQGNAKTRLLSEAENIIKEFDEQAENDGSSTTQTESDSPNNMKEMKYERARRLLQILV